MPHHARGFCNTHHAQLTAGASLRPPKGRTNTIEEIDGHAEIVLYAKADGSEVGRALISVEDIPKVQGWRWCRAPGRNTSYVHGFRGKGDAAEHIPLHRLLLDAPAGLLVDHWNGDGLDNRRENIHLVTPQENAQNRRMDRNNTSGYRGVYPTRFGWMACIQRDGMLVKLGEYETAEDAAKVAHEARAQEYANYQVRPRCERR